MKLGERLKEILETEEELRAAQEAAKQRAIEEKEKKEREWMDKILNDIYASIALQILEGKNPLVKIKDYEKRKWIESANAALNNIMSYRYGKNHDLWESLINKLKDEELELCVSEGHDGMGIKSWIEIRVKPIK